MSPLRLLVLGLALASCAGPMAVPTPDHAGSRAAVASDGGPLVSPLRPAYARALGGDMREALIALEAVSTATLTATDRAARACMLERFSAASTPPAVTGDPVLTRILGVYRAYWTEVLLGRASREAAEASLLRGLRAALGDADAGPASLDATTEALGKTLAARGFHSVEGRTSPYWDLLVWRAESQTPYDVPIPGATRRVVVVAMRDFVSLGWEGFATCDQHYPGGWADTGRLYCMADAWDPASETFAVSYLAHETEHFADYERFPKLEGPELEYRAKLVELIESQSTTRSLVAKFASQVEVRRDSPHGYANGKIVSGLATSLGVGGGDEPWRAVPESRLREAAQALFDENTRALIAAGASTVARIL